MRKKGEKKNQIESYSNRVNIHSYYSNDRYAQYYK